MKINRTMTIETNEIQIGDRIQVGHYTATCQAEPGSFPSGPVSRQGHADEREEH